MWTNLDKMSSTEQAKHDVNFARAIYATNCPLNLFDHPLWQTALVSLRPSFVPPKRGVMGGKLLNGEYDTVMAAADKKVAQAEVVAITSDGWKNIRGEGLLNFIVATPEPVFIKTIEVNHEKEGGEFLANEFSNVIDKVGEAKVSLVATDNTLANKVMWDIIETKYPHISAVGDPSHVLNLIMQDFLKFKSFAKIATMSRVLVNGIKSYRRPLAYFRTEQKRLYGRKTYSLKNYSKTRFSGILTRFKSVQANKSALQSTVLAGTTQKKPPPNSENHGKFYINPKTKLVALDDDYFWNRIPGWITAMEPIASALASMESDQVLLSDVPAAFHDISTKCIDILKGNEYLKKLIPRFMEKIEERRNFIMKDVHLAANLLDPRYRGSHLSRMEKIAASEFIAQLCDNLKYTFEEKEKASITIICYLS